jgi:hypothetical protein
MPRFGLRRVDCGTSVKFARPHGEMGRQRPGEGICRRD